MTRVRRVFLEYEDNLKQQNIIRATRARGLRDTFKIGVCTPDFSMKIGSMVTNLVFF